MNLSKIGKFLKDRTNSKKPSAQDLHVLQGYQWNTLLSYNAAVKKIVKSMEAQGKPSFNLPISADNVYHFVFWAGREEGRQRRQDIAAKMVAKYIYRIKAWHLYHNQCYPLAKEARVAVMLRASAKEDAVIPPKDKKKAVMISHLVQLARVLALGGEKEKAVLDLALVTFWGLARLGEIT
jgi:hypothetical protein